MNSDETAAPAILVLNAGSSSLKFAVYGWQTASDKLPRLFHGAIDGLGSRPRLRFFADKDGLLADRPLGAYGHPQAMACLLDWLDQPERKITLAAAGHRVVHGGEHFSRPLRLDAQHLAQLHDCTPLAPLHMPHNLAAIEALWQQRPALPQVACFDTAFHHSMPLVEQLIALPRPYRERGIRRYGFHGLSYEYIASVLPDYLGDVAEGRVIVAHLGHGASLCALHKRKSRATTMSFTPLDGLPMATRAGAIDPGVLLYLLRHEDLSLAALEELLNHQSGLLALSESSADMRQLLADQRPQAQQAIDYFVHHCRRAIGSLTAVLGGLDALVFTAGIGEHAPTVRAAICDTLGWLGIELDDEKNCASEHLISVPGARLPVCVIATDEEQVIARHTRAQLAGLIKRPDCNLGY